MSEKSKPLRPAPPHPQAVTVYMPDPLPTPTIDEIKASMARYEKERKAYEAEAKRLASDRDEPLAGVACPICKTMTLITRYRKPRREYHACEPIGGSRSWGLPSPAPVEGYHCGSCFIEFNKGIAGASSAGGMK